MSHIVSGLDLKIVIKTFSQHLGAEFALDQLRKQKIGHLGQSVTDFRFSFYDHSLLSQPMNPITDGHARDFQGLSQFFSWDKDSGISQQQLNEAIQLAGFFLKHDWNSSLED